MSLERRPLRTQHFQGPRFGHPNGDLEDVYIMVAAGSHASLEQLQAAVRDETGCPRTVPVVFKNKPRGQPERATLSLGIILGPHCPQTVYWDFCEPAPVAQQPDTLAVTPSAQAQASSGSGAQS